MPPSIAKVQYGLPVYYWGDWITEPNEFGNAVFTGGSGLAGSIPELRRCGWAVVQFSRQGLPLRATNGPLPEPLQNVGRAERDALLMTVWLFGPNFDYVFTDLLVLEAESTS